MSRRRIFRILAINPGSTSTKVALFENETVRWSEILSYTKDRLAQFDRVIDQLEIRRDDIRDLLSEKKVTPSDLSAVVGRGGPFKPLESGTYRIEESVVNDVKAGRVQADHISNIGVLLAYEIAKEAGIPSFFVDPVSVDEFEDVARISGLPDLERKSLLHALNVKATAHQAAADSGEHLSAMNFIVAHLGGGISVCPIRKGRIVDVNNANEEGPFSPERAGGLPSSSLVKLCYSGTYDYNGMKKRLVGGGGLVAHLGTSDLVEIEERIRNGDERAALIMEAMAYQIAKEIGAMATVLEGKIDAILLTGGMAYADRIIESIKKKVSFLAPVRVYPGENEMRSLTLGTLRVLKGEEVSKTY